MLQRDVPDNCRQSQQYFQVLHVYVQMVSRLVRYPDSNLQDAFFGFLQSVTEILFHVSCSGAVAAYWTCGREVMSIEDVDCSHDVFESHTNLLLGFLISLEICLRI